MQILVHPKVHLKWYSKLCICVISQKRDQKRRQRAGDHVCFDEIDPFYTLFFCMLHLLLSGKTPQSCMTRRKLHLWRPPFICICENCYLSRFFSSIFTKSSNMNGNSQLCMPENCPVRNFICLLKQWRILKLQTQFSPWNFDDILPRKADIPLGN